VFNVARPAGQPRVVGGQRLSFKRNLSHDAWSWLSATHRVIPSPPRRSRVYAVGLPRSGTHSIADAFAATCRSQHEPLFPSTIVHILDWESGRLSDARLASVLALRDKVLRLDVEASHYLHHVLAHLVQMYPESRYVLTVREPLSWLESEANQNAITRHQRYWRALEEFRYLRYGNEFECDALREAGLPFPVASYLSYWTDHLTTVVETVPDDRLLVVDTADLGRRMPEIASFIGLRPSDVDTSRVHTGVRVRRIFTITDHADRGWLSEQIKRYCLPLIEERFPFLLSNMPYA
jgi:hypothetical protein